MKRLLLSLIFTINAHAAFEYTTNDALLNGLSNSVITTREYFAAFMINPSVSASIEDSNLGVMYFKPYNLAELNSGSIIANFKFKNFGAGFSFSTFGNSIYRENQLTLNLARALFGEKMSAGINIHWNSINVKSYPNLNALGADVGLQYQITPHVHTGFSIRNINQPSLNGNREELPLVTSWGASFQIEERIIAYIAVQKDSWFAPNLLFGIRFKAGNMLSIQTGFNTYPSTPSIGLQLKKNWIAIQYAFKYHFDLGGTHFWGVSFSRN